MSPDGRCIVYPVYPSGEFGFDELYLYDALNDETNKITEHPGIYSNVFSMSKNNLIVFVDFDKEIFLYDIEQKSLEKISRPLPWFRLLFV